jgi:hypothetical protein
MEEQPACRAGPMQQFEPKAHKVIEPQAMQSLCSTNNSAEPSNSFASHTLTLKRYFTDPSYISLRPTRGRVILTSVPTLARLRTSTSLVTTSICVCR